MEVSGVIKVIGETQTFGSNGFRKREVAVTTNEQYPQVILIELVQDKCDLLNSFKIGENVKIGVNLRGREWVNPQGETKYFNTIQGWKIDRLAGGVAQAPSATSFEPAGDLNDEDYDDLPFN